MPPKPKLHKTDNNKNVSKSSCINKLDPDLQQQFEIELCWCIQQLQRTLSSGKLNKRQEEESTRKLNILMNNSTPFIKKRQVMRLTFGDYRHKMKEEHSKLSKVVMKISPVTPNKKSMFIKKSSYSRSSINDNFTFDLKTEQSAMNLAVDITKIDLKSQEGQQIRESKPFQFISSDNSFKFNFENSV